MEIYIATIIENWYEAEWQIVGCFSTEEKAKEAILDTLRVLDPDAPLLSLEIYDSQKECKYFWDVDKYALDKNVVV